MGDVTPPLLAERMAALVGRHGRTRGVFRNGNVCCFDAVDEVPDLALRIDAVIQFLQEFAKDLRVVVTARTRDHRSRSMRSI